MPSFFRLFIRQQKKYVLIYFFVVLLVAILVTARSYFYADLFDSLVESLDASSYFGFFHALIITGGIELSLFFVRIFSIAIQTRFRGYMNLYIRLYSVNHVVELDYANLAKLGSGKLLQIVHSGMQAYSYMIYEGILRCTELLVGLLALLIVLSLQNIWFLSIFILGVFLLYFFQKFAFNRFREARYRDRDLNEEYTKQTTKILMNFILLKIFGLKEHELTQLMKVGMDRVRNYTYIRFWFNAFASLANFLLILLLLASMYYFGIQYAQGIVSLELFFFIFLLFGVTRRQFYSFGIFVAKLTEELTYIQRLDEILLDSHQQQNRDSGCDLDSMFDLDLSMQNIQFSYDDSDYQLFENLSFVIPYGQKVAFVGRSGSGKSSVFKLISRLIIPQNGTISIGKHPIENISYKSIYQHIGYFYQEPLVFDGSIRENLCLNTKLDESKLLEALELAYLDHLSLDTIVGEQGVLLSGGEKQRLSLARAFLFEFDILLLDEPTSNLDLELERKVLLAIFERYNDKTIFIISHRPFILDFVDRVIVMQKGYIKADGHYSVIKDQLF